VEEFEDERSIFNALHRLQPKECLLSKKFKEKHAKFLQPFFLTVREEWHFEHKNAYSFLNRHFQVHHLDGFGLKGKVAPINAAGALLTYLQDDLSLPISHIRHLNFSSLSETLVLDMATLRHLELLESQAGDKQVSLLSTLDYTSTPMGGRLLKQWLKAPLINLSEIKKRHDAIDALRALPFAVSTLKPHLKGIRDLERLMMKVTAKLAGPRDVLSLANSLEEVAPLKRELENCGSKFIHEIKSTLLDMQEEISLIKNALVDEPPVKTNEGNMFKSGYNQELDDLKNTSRGGREWLIQYQNQIKEETGIKTLKIVYNKVFGYAIEVSRGQAKAMPDSFEKRQTLANSERFTTKALKEYESTIITAEERRNALEAELFVELLEKVAKRAEVVFLLGSSIAKLDVIVALTEASCLNNYVRPKMDESTKLEIIKGRHPVVEQVVGREYFIPNDTLLDGVEERLMLITGPNMGGKSTYIRQVALIVIMAQMGSFVPALEAHIGLLDRIFTRIGASDDLSRGQSTFMVEMSETANILNNITKRSLVILDEIGRGTSTYDGLSIAWAVAEHLLTAQTGHSKTLFATHYCELTQLESALKGACNYQAVVKESQDEVVFMHQIVKGAADKSYGIHVARLAGLPFSLIMRAQEILQQLEGATSRKEKMVKLGEKKLLKEQKEEQLQLF
jgi:DNA mismatch repair protein MutS